MPLGETLIVAPRPSPRLALVVAGLHLLALGAVTSADLSGPYRGALIVLTGIGLMLSLRPRTLPALRCLPDGRLELSDRDGWIPAEVIAETTVWSGLVVLRYRREGAPRTESRVIPADGLDADTFRRLRMWLRWKRGADRFTSRPGAESLWVRHRPGLPAPPSRSDHLR